MKRLLSFLLTLLLFLSMASAEEILLLSEEPFEEPVVCVDEELSSEPEADKAPSTEPITEEDLSPEPASDEILPGEPVEEEDVPVLPEEAVAEIDESIPELPVLAEEEVIFSELPRDAENVIQMERDTLAVGEKIQASLLIGGESASGIVVWKFEKTGIATVAKTGIVKASKVGETILTATDANGNTASRTITVVSAPRTVNMSVSKTLMGVGESAYVRNIALDNDDIGGRTVTSSNTRVLSIEADEEGYVLHALTKGTASVVLKAYNGRSKTIRVTVRAAPKEIHFEQKSLTLCVGESIRNLASVDTVSDIEYDIASGSEHVEYRNDCPVYTFDKASMSYVSAPSSDTRVLGKSVGTATLTARSYNGLTAECTVTVVPAPTDFKLLSPERKTYAVGEKAELRVSIVPEDCPRANIQYLSTNERYATVSSEGLVTFKKVGTVTILAMSPILGKIESVTFTVVKVPSSVKLVSDSGTTLSAGQTARISITLNNGNVGTYAIVGSSNPKVLTVTDEGLVTTLAEGKATVSVKAFNGRVGRLSFTVKRAPTTLKLAHTALILFQGDTTDNPATANSICGLTYSSSDDTIATVDQRGTIRAVSVGSALITAATHNGLQAICEVQVSPTLAALSFPEEALTLAAGDTWILHPTIHPEDCVAPRLSYSTANKRVAQVSADGTIKAVSAGTTKITLRGVTDPSIEATVTIQVVQAPSTVSLSARSTLLCVNQREALKVTLNNGGYGSYSFSSSKNTVLRVTKDGMMEALSEGDAVITVTTYNRRTAKLNVKVVSEPKEPFIEIPHHDSAISIAVNDSYTLVTNTDCPLTFTSDNPGIARVDSQSGIITAVSKGTANITAMTYEGGPQSTCRVIVQDTWRAIQITNASTTDSSDKYAADLWDIGRSFEPNVSSPDLNVITYTIVPENASQKYVTISGHKITAKERGEVLLNIVLFDKTQIPIYITIH